MELLICREFSFLVNGKGAKTIIYETEVNESVYRGIQVVNEFKYGKKIIYWGEAVEYNCDCKEKDTRVINGIRSFTDYNTGLGEISSSEKDLYKVYFDEVLKKSPLLKTKGSSSDWYTSKRTFKDECDNRNYPINIKNANHHFHMNNGVWLVYRQLQGDDFSHVSSPKNDKGILVKSSVMHLGSKKDWDDLVKELFGI